MIAPSIDPFSTKNRELDDGHVGRVLRRAGLIAGRADEEPVDFTRRDGTVGVVRQHSDLLSGSEPPPAEAPLVVQVSRWDRLKDMAGVLAAFADYVAPESPQAHLMLAGPDVSGVSDDPEGAEVLAACRAAWAALPEPVRKRCHLACIPMDDADENAIIINALQTTRHRCGPKESVRGFRSDRVRSFVEEPSGAGERGGRHPGSDRRRPRRPPATGPARPAPRSRSGCSGCSTTPPWGSGWGEAAICGSGTTSSAIDP